MQNERLKPGPFLKIFHTNHLKEMKYRANVSVTPKVKVIAGGQRLHGKSISSKLSFQSYRLLVYVYMFYMSL